MLRTMSQKGSRHWGCPQACHQEPEILREWICAYAWLRKAWYMHFLAECPARLLLNTSSHMSWILGVCIFSWNTMVKKETSNILIFSAPNSYLIGEPSICSQGPPREGRWRRVLRTMSRKGRQALGMPTGLPPGAWNSQRVDLRIMLDFGKLGTPIS